MNKIKVGFAPSPNLKAARSKIGSLDNATHKPGGGNVKIESRKIQIEAKPRIGARNELYTPAGGDKKVKRNKRQPHSLLFSSLLLSCLHLHFPISLRIQRFHDRSVVESIIAVFPVQVQTPVLKHTAMSL